MRLRSQVQLLRPGDKEKEAFRKQTTLASHSSRTEHSSSAHFPEGCMKGLKHLRSLQAQDAQLHSLVAGHGASPEVLAACTHHPQKQDRGCSITAMLQAPAGHPLPQLCHLESPAAIPCPCTRDGWLPLHHSKGNEAAGLSLPCHATWVELVRKRQSSENPQIWPINPPAAPKARRSSLPPHLAHTVKGTCTAGYI